MSEVNQWGLIGPGNIGKELLRQLGQDYVGERVGLSTVPYFVIRSTGIMAPDGSSPSEFSSLTDIDDFPEVTFIALPSTDDGEIAYEYASTILGRGKKVVTAEKGAAANYFSELRDESDNFSRLGINATVGGGTRLLSVSREYCQDVDNITQIHLALNGTLSEVLSSVGPQQGSGMSLGQAVQQAIKLGYAEPGSETPYDVIKLEAEADIPKKTAIFFNKLGLSDSLIDWKELKFSLGDEDIAQVIEEARVRRFIVSMYPKKQLERGMKCPEDDIIGNFSLDQGDWYIVGGFRHIDRNPLFSNLANITGPGNGLVIGLGPDESDGVYSVVGPGAGVSPTVNTMIDDYIQLS